MKSLRLLVLLLLLTAAALPAAAADWVLVANPKAGIGRLSREEVTNIYLGRYRRFASGIAADPIDQPANSLLRTRFYRQLVDKSQAEINAYWARLVFSGKTLPPRIASDSEVALQWVSRQAGALAYVERNQVDSRVIIVFEMADK